MAVVLLLAAGCLPQRAPAPPLSADGARVLGDVAWLARDALGGRATGEAGSDSAARFVAERFDSLGLQPPWPECAEQAIPGPSCYFQTFVATPTIEVAFGELPSGTTRNVIALLPGSDSALASEVVVVGAHYDHIGTSAVLATDGQMGVRVHDGADDNASGTAAMLELARRFRQAPPRRSILFVAFGAEEEGLLGSHYFVEHPVVPLYRVQAMLNFDMVGRLRGKLTVYGVGTSPELRAVVDGAGAAAGLRIDARSSAMGPSDHASFASHGIPALHFFTGKHYDYHAVTDVASRINVPGLLQIIDAAERIARELADRPTPLAGRRLRRTEHVADGALAPAASGATGSAPASSP
jgi:acetylornithine deacetylase/succinyl-diaminopimelate desuccinylase-like protein